jgi:hypothetical protein
MDQRGDEIILVQMGYPSLTAMACFAPAINHRWSDLKLDHRQVLVAVKRKRDRVRQPDIWKDR